MGMPDHGTRGYEAGNPATPAKKGRAVDAGQEEVSRGGQLTVSEPWYALACGVKGSGGGIGADDGAGRVSYGPSGVFGGGAPDCGLAAGGKPGGAGDRAASFSGGWFTWGQGRARVAGIAGGGRGLAFRGQSGNRVRRAFGTAGGDGGTDPRSGHGSGLRIVGEWKS